MPISDLITMGFGGPGFGGGGGSGGSGGSFGYSSDTVISMKYGTYEFKPVPFITLRKELLKNGDFAANIGATFRMTLTGTLTPFPDNLYGGANLIQELQADLRTALAEDGKNFNVSCNGSTIISTCPRILSIQFDTSSTNWVFTCPYTIEIEFDQDQVAEDLSMPPFIESFEEGWQVDMEQDTRHFSQDLSSVTHQVSPNYYGIDSNASFIVRVTRTLNVKGKRTFSCVGNSGTDNQGIMTSAIDNALEWMNGYSFSPAKSTDQYEYPYAHALSGVLNMDHTIFTATDHFRNTSINKHEGIVGLTETWIVVGDTGINRLALEDFEVTTKIDNTDPINTVSINGQIKGYVEQSYGQPSGTGLYSVNTTAYDNALSYWSVIKSRLFSRAQAVYQNEASTRLNPIPVIKSVGHNPSKGIITYSMDLNNRPCVLVSGALQEEISITDNYPADVFAAIPVIGRPNGPVLQAMNTTTVQTREINIDVIMPVPTGCSISALNENYPQAQVQSILCTFQSDLVSDFGQVFITENQANWNPKTGRYSQRVNYTLGKCGGTTTTGVC